MSEQDIDTGTLVKTVSDTRPFPNRDGRVVGWSRKQTGRTLFMVEFTNEHNYEHGWYFADELEAR